MECAISRVNCKTTNINGKAVFKFLIFTKFFKASVPGQPLFKTGIKSLMINTCKIPFQYKQLRTNCMAVSVVSPSSEAVANAFKDRIV